MKASRALGMAILGLAGLFVPALAQETIAPLPAVPPPAFPPMPPMDFSSPPATDLANVWKTDGAGRDYHFYANVGLSYMWLHGGNPTSSGPLMGPSFSAGVLNNRGPGMEINGSELYQSTTRSAGWEVQHKP